MNLLETKGGYFWSIFVMNTGRTVASNCAGVINLNKLSKKDLMEEYEAVPDEMLPRYKEEGIDLDYPRNQLTTPTKYREIKNSILCWSHHGNPFEVNINPGMTRSLDICRVQFNETTQSWYLVFPSEKGWRKVRIRVKAKEMIGRILLCPANEFPTILDFKIVLDSKGKPNFAPLKFSFFQKIKRKLTSRKIIYS